MLASPSALYTIPELLSRAYSLLAHNDKHSAEELGHIGMELESRSRFYHARTILERAISLDPCSHPEWYVSLAFAHFRDVTGNFAADGERVLIEGIEETDSDYLKASYLAVLEGASSEDIADLVEYLSSSSDCSVRFALGHSLLWRGEHAQALHVLREARTMLDDNSGVILGLDAYCAALNWMYAQGVATIDLDTEVRPYVERMIHCAPHVYNYRALHIQMYQVLKRYDVVISVAQNTLSTFPDEETTMVALASAYEKLGDDERAICWYNRAIGAKPSYARARSMLGKLYERRGNLSLAEEIFRDIERAFPEYYAGKIELAYFLRRIGKDCEAQALFRYAYDHLTTFEKVAVQQHPEGKVFVSDMMALELPVVH
ncbi:MAG: tetratricopeptide repeat protein [Bacteroidota bacterium]|nr:tetratricopeptide repeat protein [Candidatus Kapabacteria bacterium]MDW8219524.1 tetratricopeptide repeat protein [Bacteroidota bacterium]